MDIKFNELKKVQGESNDKVWTAYKIIGVKLEDGSDWESTNIFDNQYNEALISELKNLESGEKYAIKHKKNKQGYWTVSGIGEVDEDGGYQKSSPSRPVSGASGSGGSTSKKKGGDTMSKEEWAAKNEVDRVRIAKSVALKAAVELAKAGTKAETVVALAQEFMPFLTNDQIETPLDLGDDGLEPPEV
jgi:hypothetical protein